MFFLFDILQVITWVLGIGGMVLGILVFLDVLSRRPDAFTAADRLTKSGWLGISGGCAFVLSLWLIFGVVAPQQILWLIAIAGVLIYLVDVRPRLRDVQRGSRW